MRKVKDKLNKLAEGELDYHKVIEAEDKKFEKGLELKVRQEKVVAEIMEDIDLNHKKGGHETMKVKGGVKQTAKVVVKVVPPKAVDISEVEGKTFKLFTELEKLANLDGIKFEVEKTHTGTINFKNNSRLIFGVRYSICGDKVTYSFIGKETYKNFSKGLQGKYAPGNWDVLFDLKNGSGISQFKPIIEASISKLKKAEQPKSIAKK